MKNDTSIYFNGCSFTYGIGVHENKDVIPSLRFSKLLCDQLQVTETNVAIPGSCNDRIHRRATIDLMRSSCDVAVIMWSDPARFEVVPSDTIKCQWGEDAEQVRPFSIYSYPTKVKNAFVQYYDLISTTYKETIDTLTHMANIKILCDSRHIPCIQLPFTNGLTAEIKKCLATNHPSFKEYRRSLIQLLNFLKSDPLVFGLSENCSFDSISGCDVDPSLRTDIPGQEGHPAAKAHTIMAEWLRNVIVEKGLLRNA